MRDFERMIAQKLNEAGYEAEAKEIEKANGVILNAICLRMPGDAIGVSIYTDQMYDKNMSVDEAFEYTVKLFEENKNPDLPDMKFFLDYENVKGNLVLRLYNKKTSAEVFKSAKRYGFDDLILVPYVRVGELGAIKVQKNHIETWGVDEKTVFKDAMANTKGDVVMKSMTETLGGMEFLPPVLTNMFVVSNKKSYNGAVAIIGMLPTLKRKFPNGFYVVPSSVHEVIVISADEMPQENIDEIIGLVNLEVVHEEEVLGRKAYLFSGKDE